MTELNAQKSQEGLATLQEIVTLYQKGDFNGVIPLAESMVAQGYSIPGLYKIMAECFFATGQEALGFLHLAIDPYDDDGKKKVLELAEQIAKNVWIFFQNKDYQNCLHLIDLLAQVRYGFPDMDTIRAQCVEALEKAKNQ